MNRREELTKQHEAVNLECARLILRDPQRYGGPGSGLVLWARMVVDLDERERTGTKGLAGGSLLCETGAPLNQLRNLRRFMSKADLTA